MNDRNTEQQIHYLEEICVRLHALALKPSL